MKNKCPICKKEFNPTNNRQKFCLGKCSEEHRREYLVIYNQINKKRKIKYLKKYCEIHKKERQNYYETNKEKIKKWYKEYYQKNKQKLLNYAKKYRETHKIERSKYCKNRRTVDIKFRILCYLRSRIGSALKRNSKITSTVELLSCSVDKLKKHLESQFKSGMTWNNYGKWHIDHIRPCASFDLSKEEEQHKCFHYTNLQPLWAEENISKKNKI